LPIDRFVNIGPTRLRIMDQHLIGYMLAALVGISLGLMGSGGSILTVPILVYVMGVAPLTATAYSLFVVGVTALTGSVRNAFGGMIRCREALVFGVPSMIAVFITRLLVLPALPEVFDLWGLELPKAMLVMVLFAIVMLLSAYAMLRPEPDHNTTRTEISKYPYIKIIVWGLATGTIAGMVGAGGGFLIVPALILLTGTEVKKAIATSLLIVAVQSLLGFSGDVMISDDIDWRLLLQFTSVAVVGIFAGIALAKKIKAGQLRRAFGFFVLSMAVYILAKEFFIL
jgi:uncharacterized membrane protein YfcA